MILVRDRRRAAIFVPRWTRTRFAGSSFAVAGPAAWNSLPAYMMMMMMMSIYVQRRSYKCGLLFNAYVAEVLALNSFIFFFHLLLFTDALLRDSDAEKSSSRMTIRMLFAAVDPEALPWWRGGRRGPKSKKWEFLGKGESQSPYSQLGGLGAL